MRVYRMVQTTGKSQPGGDRGGFSRAEKAIMLSLVSRAARVPTARGIRIEMISGFHWIFMRSPPIRMYMAGGRESYDRDKRGQEEQQKRTA
jgi:hypothetical protein